MATGNSQKTARGSALEFEARLWAAAEQAVPAANGNPRKRWPCASTPRNADSFRADLHPDFKADLVPARKELAQKAFSMSDLGGENLWQHVRKLAAKSRIAGQESFNKGMEDKSRKFAEWGSELYEGVIRFTIT